MATLTTFTAGQQRLHAEEVDHRVDVAIDCDPEKGPRSVIIDNQRIDWSSVDAAMARIKAAIGSGRVARIKAPTDTPYRCIGGVIFELQRAGLMERMEFSIVPASSLSTETHQ